MKYNNAQLFVLVLLRWCIGWHFLYEGLVKLLAPGWSAKGYLLSSESFLQDFFIWLSSDAIIDIANYATIGILLFVGVTLLLGFWEKIGIIAGILLLLMFYLAHPAIPGLESAAAPSEGNYLIINKNLIELAALLVLWNFPTSRFFGMELLFSKRSYPQLAS